jgi:signal transduction histidine kinase/CheY-like chemotaxis protein
VFYTLASLEDGGEPVLIFQAGYGFKERKHLASQFHLGEGLVGQCAQEKERILLTDVPSDYVKISSGLGEATPLNIIALPILFEGSVRAVVELASFSQFSPIHQAFLDQLTESIGLVLNTIEANTLTENLLKQSQSQAQELRSRQEELSTSNEDLASQANRLAEQYSEVERKNHEVVLAKRLVEEKAEQLAVSSRYKSEFFSNMSHELRTPLNSLLILAAELEENPEKNLTESQVEYASVIRASGTDLLHLLDDILDLAKVESGTVSLDTEVVQLIEVKATIEREFVPVARKQGLFFTVELAPEHPAMTTDVGRLRQVLKNLLSNAFKFTERGGVSVRIGPAESGWNAEHSGFGAADSVLAFSISDTGVGIPADQQHLIFEAFAQADGSTSRDYGGTGLGLSISRELVRLLGGEVTLCSSDEGSTFTVYLPAALDAHNDTWDGGAATVVTPQPAPERSPLAHNGAPKSGLLADSANGVADAAIPVIAIAPFVSTPTNGHVRAAGVAVLEAPLQPMAPLAHSAGNRLDGMVLVVDDDFNNIFALAALLRRIHVEVVSAESGQQAIELVEQISDIDLVLVDIMMPGMDGYATMRELRKLASGVTIPLIAFTAKVEAGERQRCIDAGASAYVSKPVNTADLLRVLGEWLPAAPARQPPADPAE